MEAFVYILPRYTGIPAQHWQAVPEIVKRLIYILVVIKHCAEFFFSEFNDINDAKGGSVTTTKLPRQPQ